MEERFKADLLTYHKSITEEVNAVKNRVRKLVKHWPSDGEWKESALRTILRRNLPEESKVSRGFIVSREDSSTQIDLIVLKNNKPTLFKDGEFVIVTPDVPQVLVEVKTELRTSSTWFKALEKLAINAKLCDNIGENKPWTGLFTYNGSDKQVSNILNSVHDVYQEYRIKLDCITCGDDIFIRFWPIGQIEKGDPEALRYQEYWRAYKMPNLSKSYFIGNLVDAVCNVDRLETDYSWFPFQEGKKKYMVDEIKLVK